MRTPLIAVGLALAGLVWVPAETTGSDAVVAQCVKPTGVQRIVFSARKYPNVRRHFRGAVRRGWPRRLVVNRRGADERRERLLRDIPTREGFDRDEYPPGGWPRTWAGAGAWPQPARLEGRRPLRAQL